MSQARLTLRPPPNVEFVVGYPGIPAGHDRPHAEVRGTLELRLGVQGTKAKWVRVELKKVETLPGGGQASTFYDFVGQSPVKVWEAEGDWSMLHTQDFPFSIRIPESIPPSIALEKGAGIKYELNATLCTKGKKGFFFKKVDPILSTSHPIVIDKHELHSTWPVYAQPESRHVVDELLILTVDRTHTCYGPGDRVKVLATFKNDGISTAALRAFEFLLKETVIFRAGPHVSGKKGAPQVHVTPIGEQKVPVNMTVYQGQQHRAELGCFIPQTHTTTTVSSARHIDIAYSINVKAVLATGKPLLMELPVTVSNWPRNMSIEAVRRIGHSPNLSLIAPITASQRPIASTLGVVRPTPSSQTVTNQSSNYSTVPGRSGPFQVHPHKINERVAQHSGTAQVGNSGNGSVARRGYDEFGFSVTEGGPQVTRPTSSAASTDDFGEETPRRPYAATNPPRRLTLTNAEMDVEPESPPPVQRSPPKKFLSAFEEKKLLQNALGDSPGGSSSNIKPSVVTSTRPEPTNTSLQRRAVWPTAEEEKQRLFDSARQQAQKTQAIIGNYSSPMPSDAHRAGLETLRPNGPTMPIPAPAPAPKNNLATAWPTAEEEKLRLFNEAQNAARRAQIQGSMAGLSGGSGVSGGSPPATKTQFHERQPSSAGSGSFSDAFAQYPTRPSQNAEPKSAGAQIYQHAMATMSRNPSAQASVPQSVTNALSSPVSRSNAPPNMVRGRYPTAEEEKAALRYYEAKQAVDRAQNVTGYEQASSSSAPPEEPIAYDALYPSGPSPVQTNMRAASGSDYGLLNNDNQGGSFLPSIAPPSPPPVASYPVGNSALSEKERLRLKYEAEDAAASIAAAAPPSPPPRASGSRGNPPMYGGPPPSRSQPLPPSGFSDSKPLTAAEEKARLRARLEAEDAAALTASNGDNGIISTAEPLRPSLAYGHDFARPPSVSHVSHNSVAPTRTPSMSYANHSSPVLESVPSLPPPPPLAPRPPAEYIQETKEEDARTQAEDHALSGTLTDLSSVPHLNLSVDESRMDFGLSFRPFSPLDIGINIDSSNTSRTNTPSSRPPLPPKVPVSH